MKPSEKLFGRLTDRLVLGPLARAAANRQVPWLIRRRLMSLRGALAIGEMGLRCWLWGYSRPTQGPRMRKVDHE